MNASDNEFDLTGKLALITGAAGLLGPAHAKALLQCGAKVVLTDINKEQLKNCLDRLEASSDLVITCPMDVTDINSIKEADRFLKTNHQQVDILVNNAALDPKVEKGSNPAAFSRFENFSLDRWNQEYQVGLTGAFLCSQVFGTQMANKKSGVILNIASDLSVIAPDQRLYKQEGVDESEQPVKPVTYSVIKTGLIGLTRYLASYWADQNVRVNALSPGGVKTNQDESFVKKLTNLIPLGRMADSHDYQAAVKFLCSDASRYMTGQNIVIDGGRSIL